MNFSLFGEAASNWWSEPLIGGILLGAFGLLLMLPRGTVLARACGSLLGMIGFGCIAAAMPWSLGLVERIIFWGLGLITLSGAAAAVSMRNPVYSAIWFAFSLLGASGLFFFQGAQFLGVANIVVYAGAIVVTFLFVLMLSQPKGLAVYDRMSWGWFPKLFSVSAGSALVIMLTVLILRPPLDQPRWQVAQVLPLLRDDSGERLLRDDQLVSARQIISGQDSIVRITLRGDLSPRTLDQLNEQLPAALQEAAPQIASSRVELIFHPAQGDVLHHEHMAHLGAELFSRHLLAVEVVGSIILAALIGAVTIVSHGSPRRSPTERGPS